MSDDLAYWVALTRFHPFGSVRLGKLSRRFSDMKTAFEAGAAQLIEAGIEPQIVSRFLQERIHLDPQKELELLVKHQVEAITIKDPRYPKLLKEIYDPPAILFIRGRLPPHEVKHLAVVGSRKSTAYGKRAVERMIDPLARVGVVIVSGLAYGIDAEAHHTCLRADGITLAVLGSGVDQESIYPSQHRALSTAILAKGGALLSEFPIGTPPLKQHFPMRNRIIAGMCHGVLVVEAALASGSLITAKSALESGRDVYAIPGPIDAPMSEGPNNLIKQGAIAVTEPTDMFGVTLKPTKLTATYQPRSPEEAQLIAHLQNESKHIDELVRLSTLPIHVVSSTLTLLEMKGVARHDGGRYYSLV